MLDFHDVVMSCMVNLLLDKNVGVDGSEECYWKSAIDVIGREYISRIIKPYTRCNYKLFNYIYEQWKLVRGKRLREEMHLDIGFESDAVRTMNEINYVLNCKL
mmetsp:Transcript_17965/g.25392  ORF Transcript_17965/g.25392 Transcript_17965/m.25392 type:complete len:103 (+) Transcript_17965:780-1088(+)